MFLPLEGLHCKRETKRKKWGKMENENESGERGRKKKMQLKDMRYSNCTCTTKTKGTNKKKRILLKEQKNKQTKKTIQNRTGPKQKGRKQNSSRSQQSPSFKEWYKKGKKSPSCEIHAYTQGIHLLRCKGEVLKREVK